MDKFSRDQLEEFLHAVDGELDSKVAVVIIGGAAIALAYAPKYGTRDIDTWPRSGELDQKSCERARRKTGLFVPVQPSGVAQGPESFEERLKPVRRMRLKKLAVFVPERHDLAIMKTTRGYEDDMQALEQVHKRSPFDLEKLVERYRETWVTGPRSSFRLSFVALVERLFGEKDAVRVAERLKEEVA
jgi:hypothetical protein